MKGVSMDWEPSWVIEEIFYISNCTFQQGNTFIRNSIFAKILNSGFKIFPQHVLCRKMVFAKNSRSHAVLDSDDKMIQPPEVFNKKKAQYCNFIKNRLQHRYFPVNIAWFLRVPVSKNIQKFFVLTGITLRSVYFLFEIKAASIVNSIFPDVIIFHFYKH